MRRIHYRRGSLFNRNRNQIWAWMEFYLLGRSHFPPVKSEMRTKAIAIQENAVWSVASPIIRNARPRIRNTIEYRLRGRCFFMIVIIHKELHMKCRSKFNIQKYCHMVNLWNNKEIDLHVAFYSKSRCCPSWSVLNTCLNPLTKNSNSKQCKGPGTPLR